LASGDLSQFPATDRKALQQEGNFRDLPTTKALPRAILDLCIGEGGKIAGPGQPWNATDAIIDPSLPGRRLVWAVTDGNYYIVHYESGGIAHLFHFVVATFPKGASKPKLVWQADGLKCDDFTAFRRGIESGKLQFR